MTDPIEPSVREQVQARIDQVEEEHDVTVLYACESGSRAWGFPSTDSDYDVRLVYVHPRDWYLSIDLERRSDTIDPAITDEIDLHGWDLRKALGLFRTGNPTLLEWLRSPICYRDVPVVMDRWRDLVPAYYTPPTAGHAYRSMAQSVAEENLTGDTIAHKAYLYVLRALLAVRWVEREQGPVPVPFERLVAATVSRADVADAIASLVARKRDGTEQDAGARLPVLHDFIEAELDRQAALSFPEPEKRPGLSPLNTLFQWVLDRPST